MDGRVVEQAQEVEGREDEGLVDLEMNGKSLPGSNLGNPALSLGLVPRDLRPLPLAALRAR